MTAAKRQGKRGHGRGDPHGRHVKPWREDNRILKQVVRQIELMDAHTGEPDGEVRALICGELGISEKTYYRNVSRARELYRERAAQGYEELVATVTACYWHLYGESYRLAHQAKFETAQAQHLGNAIKCLEGLRALHGADKAPELGEGTVIVREYLGVRPPEPPMIETTARALPEPTP